jgi:hypothetical protein
MSAFEGIVKVAQQAKIPVVAADTDGVKRGAVAALGLNYYDIGHQTGKIVVRILQGQAPGTIASQTSNTFELHVNPAAAQKQGVTPSSRCSTCPGVVRKAGIAMSLIASSAAIEIGLIFGLVASGVFLSFRIINFRTSTVDGSFPLGGAWSPRADRGGLEPVRRNGRCDPGRRSPATSPHGSTCGCASCSCSPASW